MIVTFSAQKIHCSITPFHKTSPLVLLSGIRATLVIFFMVTFHPLSLSTKLLFPLSIGFPIVTYCHLQAPHLLHSACLCPFSQSQPSFFLPRHFISQNPPSRSFIKYISTQKSTTSPCNPFNPTNSQSQSQSHSHPHPQCQHT